MHLIFDRSSDLDVVHIGKQLTNRYAKVHDTYFWGISLLGLSSVQRSSQKLRLISITNVVSQFKLFRYQLVLTRQIAEF